MNGSSTTKTDCMQYDLEIGDIAKEVNEKSAVAKEQLEVTEDTSNTSEAEGSLQSVMMNRKNIFATLILIMGACASGAFLAIGIVNAKQNQTTAFDRMAEDFVVKLQGAFNDYEIFGLWLHESCRVKGTSTSTNNVLGICSRQAFRELYEYILSVGLDFQSAQFMPYVPHDKRLAMEAEAREFYEDKYPHVEYRGVVGLFINEEGVKVLPQDEHEFYWPVHYIGECDIVRGTYSIRELTLHPQPLDSGPMVTMIRTHCRQRSSN